MVDKRTLYNKEVSSVIRLNYSKYLKIFKTEIPDTVKAAEASAVGRSVFAHDAKVDALDSIGHLFINRLDVYGVVDIDLAR